MTPLSEAKTVPDACLCPLTVPESEAPVGVNTHWVDLTRTPAGGGLGGPGGALTVTVPFAGVTPSCSPHPGFLSPHPPSSGTSAQFLSLFLFFFFNRKEIHNLFLLVFTHNIYRIYLSVLNDLKTKQLFLGALLGCCYSLWFPSPEGSLGHSACVLAALYCADGGAS